MAQLLSPLPGTFYRRPSPDKPAYKEDGDKVKAGDVVGLIEVMKSFNEVKADADVVAAIAEVTNGAVTAQDMHETRLDWLNARKARAPETAASSDDARGAAQ